MDCSTPGFPVHHQLLELAQTHVHGVSGAIQPSHPLSVPPFSSCLQSFLASGSFPISQFFASGGQRIRASASASVLPMNIQDCFPSRWTGLISLQSKGLSRVLQHHSSKASILWHSAFFIRASLIAQLVKNLPAMQKTWIRSLGWEDPLEKGKATHSSILAWRIPWTI